MSAARPFLCLPAWALAVALGDVARGVLVTIGVLALMLLPLIALALLAVAWHTRPLAVAGTLSDLHGEPREPLLCSSSSARAFLNQDDHVRAEGHPSPSLAIPGALSVGMVPSASTGLAGPGEPRERREGDL